MRHQVLGAWVLVALGACDNPTRPVDPPVSPSTAVVAAAQPHFTVRSLGTLGGTFSGANAINERGEVAGFSQLPSGEVRAILWRAGRGMKSLGTLGGGISRARGINDRTEIVGFSQVRPGSEVSRAFLWSEPRGMRSLGTLGGKNSFGNVINNRGEVAGASENSNGRLRAFLWRPGHGMRSLGTLGGKTSEAFDMNDATQVVGTSETAEGDEHAFLWTAARRMEDLGTLGGRTSSAGGISQTGEVVGTSETAEGTIEVFLWTRKGGMRSLGSPGGQPELVLATGINSYRRVVGITFPGTEVVDLPFLGTPGRGLRLLPTLGGPNGQAQDVNELGLIVGTSWNAQDQVRATLWTPVNAPLVVASSGEGGLVEPR